MYLVMVVIEPKEGEKFAYRKGTAGSSVILLTIMMTMMAEPID